ncbi:MAG: hypothetical protein Q9211_006246 [Gyalolechia sp. 1 TL-2023]
MVSSLLALLGVASLSTALVVPRQDSPDPPFQNVPTAAKADNTFHTATPPIPSGMPPESAEIPDAVYGARSIDLPFGRLQHGKMKFFGAGQLNTPTGKTDDWKPGQNDFANQSACGIPDNAFYISKVAIHPYWLKYAPLDRYCMQDVCISFWNEETEQSKQSDMILKVTDVCSTDPNDPTSCATPYDIKIDRTKAKIMEHMGDTDTETNPALNGNEFGAGGTWWFFMKCWADALPQPAYQSPDNWFSTPPIPSNIKWAQQMQEQQWKNNQVSYKDKGLPLYPNGAYRMDRNDQTAPPIPDWQPGQPDPEWCPHKVLDKEEVKAADKVVGKAVDKAVDKAAPPSPTMASEAGVVPSGVAGATESPSSNGSASKMAESPGSEQGNDTCDSEEEDITSAGEVDNEEVDDSCEL